MKRWMRKATVILTAALAVWTVFVTWAAARISTFIVSNDAVNAEMGASGYSLERTLAEAIHVLRSVGLVPIVAIVVVIVMLTIQLLLREKQQPTKIMKKV